MAHVLSAPVSTRTSIAPRWRRGRAWWLLLAAGLAVLAGGGQMLLSRQHLKRFHVVRPGVWYRTAQPSQWSLSWLVRQHGVRTVLCLRHFEEIPLRGGLFDFDSSDGVNEAVYVRDQLGLNFVQWPMGDEPYWPWCTPNQFEALFRLVDDPNNHPIVVHCVGGRHRTGTMTALFRMEYDRWTPDDALAEMYSVDFGHSMAIQDHNLRTYLPRPLPSDAASRALQERFSSLVGLNAAADYATLVRAVRGARGNPLLEAALVDYVSRGQPFALAWAARLIDTPDDPIARVAASQAFIRLAVEESADGDLESLSVAAALVADFGQTTHQRMLADWLIAQQKLTQATPEYEAVVAGLTNRYTPNRAAWLACLLDDERPRVGRYTANLRYCETAVARLCPIADANFIRTVPNVDVWRQAVAEARQWLAEHPQLLEFTTLQPVRADNPVRPGREGGIEQVSHPRPTIIR